MNRPCPVCDSAAADVLHTQRFVLPDGCPLPMQYDVVCCTACGFIYADVSAADYTGFYREQSKYAAPDGEWDRKRFKDTAKDIAAFLPNHPGYVLDVGCANGGLLAALRDIGITNSLGVELSQESVMNARKQGIHATPGTFADLPRGPFDLVILSHVLEHLPDPKAALRAVADVLAPDGCVYVEVPDAMRYGEFLISPYLDINCEHVNHFSQRTLQNLALECGLEADVVRDKILETPSPYPALSAFFRRATPDAMRWQETWLRARIESYLARSRDMMRRIDARLREVTGPVMVWGAGQLTYKLLADTCLGSMRIAAFIDANPVYQGRRLAGCPIVPPPVSFGFAAELPIVVASLMHEQSIVAAIKEYEGRNPIITLGDACA